MVKNTSKCEAVDSVILVGPLNISQKPKPLVKLSNSLHSVNLGDKILEFRSPTINNFETHENPFSHSKSEVLIRRPV